VSFLAGINATLATTNQPLIQTLGTLLSLNISGNVTASSFYGDGSKLTNIQVQGVGQPIGTTGLLLDGVYLSRHSENTLIGNLANTHVNLGFFSVTGQAGESNEFDTIGGGLDNIASKDFATVGGGHTNISSGYGALIGGGIENTAAGPYATIAGGENNYSTEYASSILGGSDNEAIGEFSSIGGGETNYATSYAATIAGGSENEASGELSTIGGGIFNLALSYGTTVSGGDKNTAEEPYASIGGGFINTASGFYATVSGGYANNAGENSSSVGGGDHNEAIEVGSTVSGGTDNEASGLYSTVGGGMNNSASGYGTTISGGQDNEVGGMNSAIAGGRGLALTGDGSLGFRGGDSSTQISRSESNSVYLMEVALCIGAESTDCTMTMTPGQTYADAHNTSNGDYAEYFFTEENLSSGDIVGLNSKSRKVRKFRPGDLLVGIISKNPGIAGNHEIREQGKSALVGLMGQLPFNREQVRINGPEVTTTDGQFLGYLLSDGRVFINISPGHQALNSSIRSLKKQNEELNKKLRTLEKNMRLLLQSLN
jgi:hypothetical protein